MLFTVDEGQRQLLGVFPSVGHPRLVCPSWDSSTEQRAVNSAPILTLLSQKLGSKRQINLLSLLPTPRGELSVREEQDSAPVMAVRSTRVVCIYPPGVPGTHGCALSRSCHVTGTDPSNSSSSFPGYRPPLPPPSWAPSPPSFRQPGVPWVSQPPSCPLSLGLLTSFPLGLQVSHASTLSPPLPWQSALHWAFLCRLLSSGHSQEQRHLGDPAESGLAAAKQGWGQGEGCSGKLHAGSSARTFNVKASSVVIQAWTLGRVLSARVLNFIWGGGDILFQIRVGRRLRSEIEKKMRAKKIWKMTVGRLKRRREGAKLIH